MFRAEFPKARALLQQRRRDIGLGRVPLSYRQIEKLTHVPKTDLWNWDHEDMSSEAQVLRAEARAWNRYVSVEARFEVGGFIIYRNITRRDTSTATIQEYIWRRFQYHADDSYVSGLRAFCHMTSRKVVKVMRGALSHSSIEKAIKTLEEFRNLIIAPDKIVITDKIYFSDTPKKSVQTGMIGLCGTLIHSNANPVPHRHSLAATCLGSFQIITELSRGFGSLYVATVMLRNLSSIPPDKTSPLSTWKVPISACTSGQQETLGPVEEIERLCSTYTPRLDLGVLSEETIVLQLLFPHLSRSINAQSLPF
jgi:hypothetical protein